MRRVAHQTAQQVSNVQPELAQALEQLSESAPFVAAQVDQVRAETREMNNIDKMDKQTARNAKQGIALLPKC